MEERVTGAVPRHNGQPVTRLGTLGVHGLQAVRTVAGATETDGLRPSGRQVLGPPLRPGALVVRDNLGVHKAVGIQPMRARRQARGLYLPPSSPDRAPSEPCWGNVNVALRKATARPRTALEAAITQAVAGIMPTAAWRGFIPCNEALQ
jgi:transposase